MMQIQGMGKLLMVLGGVSVQAGLLLVFSDRIPFFGRLPGDIEIRGKNFVFYFPLATMLILNAVLSLILWLITRR
jgi:hypothetical protein